MTTPTALPPQSRSPQNPARSPFQFARAAALVVLAALLTLAAGTAQAASPYTWTPLTAGPFNWNNASSQNNWGQGTASFPNAIGDVASMNVNLSANQVVNLNQAITVGSLTIGDNSGSQTATLAPNGGSLTFDVSSGNASLIRTATGTGATTISANITLNDNLDISLASGAANSTMTISGNISGSSKSISKASSTLTLVLSGANTYTGSTTISAGTLGLGAASPFGTTPGVDGTSGIFLAAGTTVRADAAAGSTTTVAAPITLAGVGDINLSIGAGASGNTTTYTLNGTIGGATSNLIFTTTTGSFNNGGSVFVLGAAGTYTGNTLITTGNGGNNPVTVKAAAGVSNALPATTVLTFDQVAGGGSFRTFQYDMNGNDQTLAGLSNGGAVPQLRRMTVTSPTAATLTINNTADYTFGGAYFNSANSATTRAQIQGAIALTKNGTGTFTLGGTLTGGATAGGNTFTGNTKVLGGILVLGETIALQNSAFDTANSITGNAANGLRTTVTTLTLGGLTGNKNFADVFTTTSGGYSGVTALTLNNTNASPTSIYSGIIADGASGMTLTKTGSGTQTLSGANSYSGSTTVSTGTLKLGASNVIPDGASKGDVTVTGTLDLNTFSETINGLSGAGTVDTVAGGSPTLTVGGNDQTSTFSGSITNSIGTLNLAKSGTGTVTLSGANSYSGVTTVNAGKLVVTSTHTGTGAVTNNATLSVTASGTSQWQPATLTLANPCTLEFNSVTNSGTTTVPLLPGAAVGAVANVTVNVSSISGTAVIGNSYPLLGQVSATNGYSLGTQPPNITGRLDVNGTTLVYVVEAAPDVWAGTDVTNPTWWDINSSTNWTGGAVAGSYTQGDAVLFEDAFSPASPVTVEIRTAVTPGSVTFANSTKEYTVNTSGAFGIGGSGALTKSGSATLTLNNSNSYSGGTTLSGGILTNANNNALGSGAVTIGTSAVRLVVNDGVTLTNNITINGGTGQGSHGLIENSGAANATLGGGAITINGAPGLGSHFASIASGSLTVSNAINSAATPVGFRTGTGIFSGGGSYSSFILYAGTLKLGAINGLSPSATLTLGNAGAANFDLAGYNQSLAGMVKGANAATIGNSLATSTASLTTTGNSSYAGIIADNFGSGGTVALTVNGGALTNTGANTYSGGTTVTGGGNLQATVMTTANALGTGPASVAAGSTLILNNTNTTSTASAIDNTITGSGLLKLQFAAGTTPRDTTMPNVTGFSGNIRLANLGSTGDKWDAPGLGTVAGSLTVDSGSTIFASSGPAFFTGGITLNGAGNSESRGALRLGATTLGGNISLASSSTINLEDAAAALTGDITSGAAGAQTLTLGAAGSTGGNVSGIIGGGTGIINVAVAGAGTYTLSGQNTYTGGTTNSGTGGIIIANNAAALGTGPLTFTGGRRLVVNTGLNITNAITIAAGGGESGRGMLESGPTAGTATLSGPITVNSSSVAGGHLVASAGTILHITGVITSTVPVTSRAGTVMLSGGGTGYSNFNVQGGIVQVGAANGMSTAATVTVGGSATATLDLNGFNQSFVGLIKGANPATITNSSTTTPAVLTLTGSTTTNFAGVIKDDGGVGKIGITVNGGSATLFGVNTYSGNTTISSGSLALSGSGSIANTPSIAVAGGATFDVSGLTSTFTLGAAQTLSGNGTVVGPVTANGTVAAGASIGTLTFSGAVTNNGTILAEITNGPCADKIVFNGGAQLGGNLVVTNLGTLANGNTYDLFDGTLTGSFSSMTLPNGLAHWITNQVTAGGDGTITFTNTAPVAINTTNSVPQGGSVNIPLNNGKFLLATDAENDPLTITSVSATLGTVATDGSSINYTNTSAGASDSISYMVSDGFGGTDTKTITVHITSATGANLVSATAGGGNAYLSYAGIPTYNYALDKATGITPPITWVPQVTNVADGFGRLNYTNSLSLWPTNDFFRTRYVP